MSDLLEAARALIDGQRAVDYGDVNESFTRIAGLWSAYLNTPIDAHDVAYMMVLLKISRLRGSKLHRDSHLDAIAYVLCADRINDSAVVAGNDECA